MKRVLLKQETLDKIDKLKKIYNIKKDTSYIKGLVDKEFTKYRMVYGEFEYDKIEK